MAAPDVHLTLHTDESGEFEGALRETPVVCGLLLPRFTPDQTSSLGARLAALQAEAGLGTLHGGELGRLHRDARDAIARAIVQAVFDTLGDAQRDEAERGLPSRPTLVVLRAEHLDVAGHGFTSDGFGANRYVRMLLELLRQVVAYSRYGDASIDLRLASRVFPARPEARTVLEQLGYQRHRRRADLMYVADATALSTGLQVLLGDADPRHVAEVTSLAVESIGSADDPRFTVVDQLANFIHRHRELLDGSPRAISAALEAPLLRVDVRARGRALEALTQAHDAYRAGELIPAFDALTAHEQPAHHARYVAYLQRRILEQAREVMAGQPLLSERLLARAEAIVEHRAHHLLGDAALAAELVATQERDRSRSTRATVVLATIANRRGDVAGALDAFDRALVSLDAEPPSLATFLQRASLQNRRAAARINAFGFAEAEAELAPWLELVEGVAREALGPAARERIAGFIATTLGHAAAHQHRWDRTERALERAQRHLGEEHGVATLRAHAAVSRGDRGAALAAAAEALGSAPGREGYDRVAGARRLGEAGEHVDDDLGVRAGDVLLQLRLAERAWIADPERLWDATERALAGSTRTHRPMLLIHLAHGRLAVALGRPTDADRIWARAERLFAADEAQPTVALLRVQLLAERARVAVGPEARELSRAIPGELDRALGWLPAARPWFEAARAGLAAARSRAARGEALEALLARYTFLHR